MSFRLELQVGQKLREKLEFNLWNIRDRIKKNREIQDIFEVDGTKCSGRWELGGKTDEI